MFYKRLKERVARNSDIVDSLDKDMRNLKKALICRDVLEMVRDSVPVLTGVYEGNVIASYSVQYNSASRFSGNYRIETCTKSGFKNKADAIAFAEMRVVENEGYYKRNKSYGRVEK